MSSRVGFAAIKITPKDNGIPLGGYYVRYSTGVHDDVYVRTLYLAADEEVFIIACDLLTMYGKFIRRMRRSINRHTGVKEENILICSLHDHSAPDTLGLEGIKGFFKYTLGAEWFQRIQKKIVKSAILAKQNARTGKIGIRSKQIPIDEKLVINRRHPQKELKYPFSIMKITSHNDLIAAIINYACHETTLNQKNTLISAEYSGYLLRKLKKALSLPFSMYLNGPCGDINPYLFPEDWDFDKINFEYYLQGDFGSYNDLCSYEHTKRIGERLADHAIELLQDVETKKLNNISVITKKLEIPIQYHHPKMKVTELLLTILVKKGLFNLVKALNRSNVNYLSFIKKNGKMYAQVELQFIRINEDILIIAIPAEVFSEIGEELISKSPIKHTIIVELANDYIGYVFPYHECEFGGYEVFGIANLAGVLPGTIIKNTILKIYHDILK